MAEPAANRRLAAILAADVVGYSKLMGADELGTIEALRKHRDEIFNPEVTNHNGRVFKLMGDGTLVEFSSVVDAVKCAMAIQHAVASETLPDGAPKIKLRIGINLGDVILDGEDLYGDGVNIAARLEPLAEHGGICVSSIVNESVNGRIEVEFRDGGEVEVKNIARPLRVWKWLPDTAMAATASPPADETEPAGPTRSIAVLPFDNMSGDAEQEYFSDGISEDIITDLSKVSGLLVIARNSSFAYKGQSVDLRQVGRELGVTNILEGSIRRAGNRVRINAQLIDATDGSHIWAERFDRDLTDIFEVQDEVTMHIVQALKVALSPEEEARIASVGTKVPEAHDLLLRGRQLITRGISTAEIFHEAESHFTRAVELDPTFGAAYAGLSMALTFDHLNRWSPKWEISLERARHNANRAIELAPDEPYAYFAKTISYAMSGDVDEARAATDKALELNPSFAPGYNSRGAFKIIADGKPEEGILDIEKSLNLDPGGSQQALHFLGLGHLLLGNYETAAMAFRERIVKVPETDFSRSFLIATLGYLGDTEEAAKVWAELKSINPDYVLDQHLGQLNFGDSGGDEVIREGHRRAGVASN